MPPIEVENLHHAYGDRQALVGVTFDVSQGEIFGVLGPNGGGKTTLFKILSTLIPANKGRVRLFGTIRPTNRTKLENTWGWFFSILVGFEAYNR